MSTDQQIIENGVVDELKTSFLSYAMSVIVSRALPDVRDGLKPVHRRILYTMERLNLTPSKGYVKSARVVGEAMGKYHPHGDTAIYDALVRMAQDWSMRLPLIDGHGNFGTHTDPAAAMRYCLAGQERVRLADGRSPRIDELAASHGLKEAGEATLELEVLDKDGKPVHADRVFHSGEHPVKRVELDSGHALTGTHNHPVLCLIQVEGVPVLQWLRLDELKPGTVVALARTYTDEVIPSEAERQLGTLLGAWAAEGWFSGRRAGADNTDADYFALVRQAFESLVPAQLGETRAEITATGKTLLKLCTYDLPAVEASPLAELIGHGSRTKFVPDTVWSGGMGVKRAFLQALYEGDGSIDFGPRDAAQVVYTTYSRRLADEVQELLLEFGVFASRWDDEHRGGYKLLISSRENVRRFATHVGFLTRKQKTLTDYLDQHPGLTRQLGGDYVPYVSDFVRSELAGKYASGATWVAKNNFDRTDRWRTNRETILGKIRDEAVKALIIPIMDSGWRFVRVKEITDAGTAPVYSIRVKSEDHSFLAGGFINHNTEARMSQAALAMVDELDEDTVDFAPNYDGSQQEPKVLPAAFPNLLVNGSEGIAVGMATKMPPHNLGETVAACKHMLRNPDATVEDLMRFIPAPDLPTGGTILNPEGIKEAYTTGRGMFVMRARTHFEDVSARRKGIVVTELPYQVGPEQVIAAIKKQRDAKRLAGVANVVDLTDRKSGLRLVIECKTGFQPQAVLDELLRLTPLQTNFNVHNLALVGGQPRTLTLRDMVKHYVDHRVEVTTRRCQFRKKKAEARAHLLEGFLIALAAIEEVVAVIKKSKDTATARGALTKKFKLTETQANAILEMPLRRLTGLEVEKIRAELAELTEQIAELTRLLSDQDAMNDLICAELDSMVATYGNARRSQLSTDTPTVAPVNEAEARIPKADTVVTLSSTGLLAHWTAPFTGTRGKHDAVVAQVATDTHSQIGVVTNTGRVEFLPVLEITAGQGKERGTPVGEYVDLDAGERVVGLVPLGAQVAMSTRQGVVKVLNAADFPKKTGQTIIGLKDAGDEVISAVPVPDGESDLVFITATAQLLRTGTSGVRPQGRTGGGVAGIKLADGDQVVAFAVVAAGDDPAVVTVAGGKNGTSVKTTPLSQFPAKGRATGGVRCHRLLRGEDGLVTAGVGDGLVGVAATGGLVTLPDEVGKRDGAGTKTTAAVTLLGVRR